MTCDHLRLRPGRERFGLGPAADEYAMAGFAVLPLDRGGKRPHRMLGREGGVYNATTDSQQVVEWWLQDPAANIGVAAGTMSRLLVVDLDVKNGRNGPAELATAMDAWELSLPPGPCVSTPSGGWHLWLGWPWAGDHAAPERPDILPGVDMKGTGGLVVAPPSMQLITPSGRDAPARPVPVPYQLVSGCPLCYLPEVPAWLAEWVFRTPAKAAQPGESEVDVYQVIEHGAPAGQRNTTYYKLACSLFRKFGQTPVGEQRVRMLVEQAWRAGETAGMDWKEVQVIIESARRFIAGHPDPMAAWAMKPENQFWRK